VTQKPTVEYVFKTDGIQSPRQYIRHQVWWRQTRKSLYLITDIQQPYKNEAGHTMIKCVWIKQQWSIYQRQ